MQLESKVKAVKEEKSYGHLNINSQNFPFVKDCKIGEVKELTIKLRVKGLRAPDKWEISEQKMKPTDVIVQGNIVGIEHKPKAKKKDKSL